MFVPRIDFARLDLILRGIVPVRFADGFNNLRRTQGVKQLDALIALTKQSRDNDGRVVVSPLRQILIFFPNYYAKKFGNFKLLIIHFARVPQSFETKSLPLH